MKFKDVLKEEFYDSFKYKTDYSEKRHVIEFWKNPSSKELREIAHAHSFARGVLLKNGDLFITDSHDIIHDDILSILEKRGILNFNKFWFDDVKILNNYLCVHVESTKKVYPAESYRQNVYDALEEKYFDIYSKILKKKNNMLILETRDD